MVSLLSLANLGHLDDSFLKDLRSDILLSSSRTDERIGQVAVTIKLGLLPGSNKQSLAQ